MSAAAALPAQLTLHNAGQILDVLSRQLLQESPAVANLDAGALQSFDSSAIAVLLELRRRLIAQGKSLHIVDWPQRLQALVALYGVGELLQV